MEMESKFAKEMTKKLKDAFRFYGNSKDDGSIDESKPPRTFSFDIFYYMQKGDWVLRVVGTQGFWKESTNKDNIIAVFNFENKEFQSFVKIPDLFSSEEEAEQYIKNAAIGCIKSIIETLQKKGN